MDSADEKQGPAAIKYVRKLREQAEKEHLEILKSRDVDGSLTALYKIHSLIPDVCKMCNEELLDLLVKSVVYNSDDLIVLNKPYGLSVTEGPSMGKSVNSLLPALCERIAPKSDQLLTAHRIDRCTTGLLLLATSRLRWTELRDMFRQKEISKSYMCITKLVPKQPSGTIKVPIGQCKLGKSFKIVPLQLNNEDKPKIRRHRDDARMVETSYEVLKEGEKCALVKCSSQSGMKHQIRSHLGLHLGTPILGDHKYSYFFGQKPQKLPSEILHKLGIRTSKCRHLPMYLHASEVIIPDYRGGMALKLFAEVPKFFSYTLKKLRL